ncbi:MAG: tyrosine-type recombinase/integrase, partial [Treponema sp.]|nr:tyrosine-type recombinase/integrase [Treponema sp.]
MNAEETRSLALRLVMDDMTGSHYSEHYRKEVSKFIKDFYSWAVKRSKGNLKEITRKDLVSYHRFLENTKSKRNGNLISSSSVDNRYNSVRMVFRQLYICGLIEENPCHGLDLRTRKTKDFRRNPLSQDEINLFLESIETDTKLGLRDRTMFELIYSSGLRIGEVSNLKIGDIKFEEREMIVRGKFDRDRVVPISKV